MSAPAKPRRKAPGSSQAPDGDEYRRSRLRVFRVQRFHSLAGLPADLSITSNTRGWRKSRWLVAVAGVAFLTIAGCGGSSTPTTTTHPNAAAAALGHRIAETMAMFQISPQAVVRRYGDTFGKLSPAEQRLAMKAAARDFEAQGQTPLTQGKAGAVLRALGRIRDQ